MREVLGRWRVARSEPQSSALLRAEAPVSSNLSADWKLRAADPCFLKRSLVVISKASSHSAGLESNSPLIPNDTPFQNSHSSHIITNWNLFHIYLKRNFFAVPQMSTKHLFYSLSIYRVVTVKMNLVYNFTVTKSLFWRFSKLHKYFILYCYFFLQYFIGWINKEGFLIFRVNTVAPIANFIRGIFTINYLMGFNVIFEWMNFCKIRNIFIVFQKFIYTSIKDSKLVCEIITMMGISGITRSAYNIKLFLFKSKWSIMLWYQIFQM